MLKPPVNSQKASTLQQQRNAEAGYMLIGVLVLVAMLLIALAVAAPRVAVDLQRDKEDELMHRGMQYPRAIRLYFKKFGRYPTSLDQLEKTNEIRFLRKRYTDPVSDKDEWRLIHYGEALVKPTGLFGQPITAAGGLGSPAGGAAGVGSNPQSGLTGTSFGPAASLGGSAPGSSMGGSSFGQSGSQTGIGGGSSFGQSGSQTGIGGGGLSSSPGGIGSGNSGTGTGGSGFGGSGQTFGGGGIVGVASTSAKASIREFKKQKHYNEWEFVYDPQQEQMGQNGTGILQQPGANNPNNNVGAPTVPASGGTSPTPTPSP